MKIAKEFRWEMGHRLKFHKGKCKNLHGHSYRMTVELEGELNSEGMVLDYYDLKAIVKPVIEELDHAFMVNKTDTELLDILKQMESRLVMVDFESTSENICLYLLDKLKNAGLPQNISKVRVRIYETGTAYAEEEIDIFK